MADEAAIRSEAIRLAGEPDDHDALLDLVGDARFVLLGEASHGTEEFYRERARISRRLIEERGFAAIAVEADWPDAYRVTCFVRGAGDDATPADALGGFSRFPTWMWRNTEIVDLVGWLRSYNEGSADPVGFYGLDLYSMTTSMDAVVSTLEGIDPDAAARARARYACFDHYDDPQDYGAAAAFGAGQSCEDRVVEQLVDLCSQVAEWGGRDDVFFAEQNARLVKNAEEYYRSMFRGRVSTWNLRDQHMADTLDDVADHLGGKIVVWEHNSHLGDARATEMGRRGELNVGQLVRERHPGDVVNVGFTTYTGTVTAADDWGGQGKTKRVNVALDGSYEDLLHRVGVDRFFLPLRGSSPAAEALRRPRLERAIGVIYRPQTERVSHYFEARLADQFDGVIHLDETTALQPLA